MTAMKDKRINKKKKSLTALEPKQKEEMNIKDPGKFTMKNMELALQVIDDTTLLNSMGNKRAIMTSV
jgi:hypothetical protein